MRSFARVAAASGWGRSPWRPMWRSEAEQPQPPKRGPRPKPYAMLRKLREEITANADYVGAKFPEEARKIHFEEVAPRNIYGEATLEEANELTEEGIPVCPLPPLPEDQDLSPCKEASSNKLVVGGRPVYSLDDLILECRRALVFAHQGLKNAPLTSTPTSQTHLRAARRPFSRVRARISCGRRAELQNSERAENGSPPSAPAKPDPSAEQSKSAPAAEAKPNSKSEAARPNPNTAAPEAGSQIVINIDKSRQEMTVFVDGWRNTPGR